MLVKKDLLASIDWGKKIATTIVIFFMLVLVFFCPSQQFFTHMETSPLPVKGCKFLPMLGTHDHWTVSFLSVPHLLYVTRASVYTGHLRGCIRDTPNSCGAFGHGDVTTCFYDMGLSRLGFEHPTFRLASERSSPLRHRRGCGS